eukprot:scaffold9478_cov138-Skeletonema_menzelii.AAC.5
MQNTSRGECITYVRETAEEELTPGEYTSVTTTESQLVQSAKNIPLRDMDTVERHRNSQEIFCRSMQERTKRSFTNVFFHVLVIMLELTTELYG